MPSPRPRPSNDDQALAEKDLLSTGEAARLCNVSQQTIIRCFDNGRLHGFRVPGSRFRRIPRNELLRFMRENGIPTDALASAARRILIVDNDAQSSTLLAGALQRSGGYDVETASDPFDAGVAVATHNPHLIVLDAALAGLRPDAAVRRLRARAETERTVVVCVHGAASQSDIETLRTAGADEVVRRPFSVDRLVERVGELLAPTAGGRNGDHNDGSVKP